MMKNHKKATILLSALLLVVLSAGGYITYARYISKGAGETSVSVAKWAINIDGQTVAYNTPATITKTLTWTGLGENVVSGFIAPGASTTASIYIDPTGSQVSMNFYVKASIDNTIGNENITVANTVSAQSCSVAVDSIAECTGEGSLSDVTLTLENEGTYAGYYKGTIALTGNTAMDGTKKVFISLPIQWTDDYENDASNDLDTSTGIAAPTGNVNFDVVVEQKVN